MDVTKELVCIKTTGNVSKWKQDYYRPSMLCLYYQNFKFQNCQINEISCEL